MRFYHLTLLFLSLVQFSKLIALNSPSTLSGKIEIVAGMDDSNIYVAYYIDDTNVKWINGLNGDELHEPFYDSNSDGTWTPEEIYADANLNGQWDEGEIFSDADLDGVYDTAEIYNDQNNNGVWDQGEELSEGLQTYTWDSISQEIGYDDQEDTFQYILLKNINDLIYVFVQRGYVSIIYDENLDFDKNGTADKDQFHEMKNLDFFFGNLTRYSENWSPERPFIKDLIFNPFFGDYLMSIIPQTHSLNTYQSNNLDNWELLDSINISTSNENLFLKSELVPIE